MRRPIGLLIALLGLACGGDKMVGPESIAGNYSLKTVNGFALPFVVIQSGRESLEVTSGALSVNGDNSYVLTFDLRETLDATVTIETTTEQGTYKRSGNALSFHPNDDSGDWSAAYAGGTLTMTTDGVTLTFQR